MKRIELAPSMMCANYLNMKEEIDQFEQQGIDWLHIDIMDGNYVPNLGLGLDFCRVLATYTRLPLDFHLMVEHVDNYLDPVCSLAAGRVTFHPETSRHPVRTIQKIRQFGCQPGIAVDPSISIDSIKHLIPLVDQICVMAVNPGYAGQQLLPFCLEKIGELDRYLSGISHACRIQVDGNVSWMNIPRMVEAGADNLVLGTSSLFDKDYSIDKNLSRIRALLAESDRQHESTLS